MEEIGLFPLPLVLVPGEQTPLHVFEPRYKELIGECLDQGQPFGLVLADDEGMRDVGTEATVVEVLEQFEDGRLNVVVEGQSRFKLLELTEGRTFATAEERERCLAAYDRVVEAAAAELDDFDRAGDFISFQIVSRIDLGTEVKQALLETRSERERVLRLAELLDGAAEAVAREREVRDRASGNGRVEAL